MKKILSVIAIVMLFCICLTSCESSKKPNTTQNTKQAANQEIKQVTLSANNINQYLNIKGQYGKTKTTSAMGLSVGNSDLTVNIYPVRPGSFYNVTITLKIKLETGWTVRNDDPAYSGSEKGYLTTTIILPANGSAEETHLISAVGGYWELKSQNIDIQIVSVSGTFVPATKNCKIQKALVFNRRFFFAFWSPILQKTAERKSFCRFSQGSSEK